MVYDWLRFAFPVADGCSVSSPLAAGLVPVLVAGPSAPDRFAIWINLPLTGSIDFVRRRRKYILSTGTSY
jgi:hypothetical protein